MVTHHVQHSDVGKRRFTSIRTALKCYRQVFSTNYDLLVYWAMMSFGEGETCDDFVDYFFGEPFDAARIGSHWPGQRTAVYYLHGALHLYRNLYGQTIKRARGEQGLLENFFPKDDMRNVPQFVSEGSAEDKRLAIASSDYLSFAQSKLSGCTGSLVIFGHALAQNTDQHLVDAIRNSQVKRIAISMMKEENADGIIKRKADLRKRFGSTKEVLFFDASSHSLGDPQLSVDEDETISSLPD